LLTRRQRQMCIRDRSGAACADPAGMRSAAVATLAATAEANFLREITILTSLFSVYPLD
jgi:hypothetical protein